MHIHKQSLSPAECLSDKGVKWLGELSTNLKALAEELQMFANEGGNPLTKKQVIMIKTFSKAATDVKDITLEIEKFLSQSSGFH
jgi:hypothetical protein